MGNIHCYQANLIPRLSIRTYSLLKRILGLDAERRALQTALKEAELHALRARHAAELLRLERTLLLLELEAESERSEKVSPIGDIYSTLGKRTIQVTKDLMQETSDAKHVDKEGSRTLHFFDDDEDK